MLVEHSVPVAAEIDWLGERGAPAVSLTLPLPPSANRIWRTGGGRTYAAADYKAWARTVGQHVMIGRAADAIPHRYTMRVVLPEQAKDPTNLVKPLEDSLQKAGVIANDKHLRRLLLEVDETREPGTLLVEIWALPGEPPASARKPRTRKPRAGKLL